MVVQAILGLALALPTGMLFGLGYGTGVRIGYEQIYPLLFPKGARLSTSETVSAVQEINTIYNAIGGKEASQMGIGMGIASAGELLEHPNFRVLEELESRLSGRMPGSLNPHVPFVEPYPPVLDSNLTIEEKMFLIARINKETDIHELERILRQWKDPNLLQVIRARLAVLHKEKVADQPGGIPPPPPPPDPTPIKTKEQEEFDTFTTLHNVQIIKLQESLRFYTKYVTAVKVIMVRVRQTQKSVDNYRARLRQRHNGFKTQRRHYINFLTIQSNSRNSMIHTSIIAFRKHIPGIPVLYTV